jgi:hypothetical protein
MNESNALPCQCTDCSPDCACGCRSNNAAAPGVQAPSCPCGDACSCDPCRCTGCSC